MPILNFQLVVTKSILFVAMVNLAWLPSVMESIGILMNMEIS